MSRMLRENELFRRAERAFPGTQRALAELLGVSSRTIMRWNGKPGYVDDARWADLARAVHPTDRDLARELAAHVGHTLESLGLEHPPAQRAPQPRELADAIVCAAAEVASMTPQAIRPALHAAFARAVVFGFTAEAARDALAPEAPAPRPRGKG
jgi:hypothetical protein